MTACCRSRWKGLGNPLSGIKVGGRPARRLIIVIERILGSNCLNSNLDSAISSKFIIFQIKGGMQSEDKVPRKSKGGRPIECGCRGLISEKEGILAEQTERK